MDQTTPQQNLGSDARFAQYIDVVNRVIGENRDSIYGKAVGLWDKTIGDKPLAVGVYASDAQNPHHWYTIELSDGTFSLVNSGKRDDASFDWKLSDDHVSEVIENPSTYVEHPMRLDLNWLKTRVGLN